MELESSETLYDLLKFLEHHPEATQRQLAEAMGISLGKLHYCLKALVEKGWIKAGRFLHSSSKKSYSYILTPEGIEAKIRLTRQFLIRKMAEYDRLRQEIEVLRAETRLFKQDSAAAEAKATYKRPASTDIQRTDREGV